MADNGGSEDSLMQNDDEKTKEVVNILKEVRANLSEIGKTQLDDEIKQVAKECIEKGDMSLRIVSEIMRNFVNVVSVKLGVSLEETKQILRIFLLCWNKQGLAEAIMKDIYNEDEPEEPEVDEKMPMEVKGLDDKKLAMYARALREGHENVQRIRAMVVGMFSVGKTSLVNNLIDGLKNKRPPHVQVDEQYPPSTEGIDVHLCKIENEKWKKLALTQKRNVKHTFERAIEQNDFPDSITPVVEHEQQQEENMDVSEPPEENTQVKETVQPPVNDPVDLEKLKKFVQPDAIESKEEIPRTIHSTAHEEIIKETDIQGNPPLVSVWDFAGQNLYYSTHHFFLNKRSIYLLLMNMTKKLSDLVEERKALAGLVHEKFTCLDAFKFWLNSIHMYSSIHDQEHEDKPTVILIGTHKDEMSGTEEDKEEQMNAFFNKALRPFIGTNILKHVHRRKFLVNNLNAKDPVFDEIRNEVKRVAEGQPYWNEKHPLKWIQLEKTFEQMRGDGTEMVKLREVEDANRENPKPLNSDQLKLFLQIQHMYGNILYFDTNELKEHVILSPQWIIEAFKCFINHKQKHVPPELLKEWQSYKESAVLEPELLQAILTHSAPQIKANAAIVVEYMEYLNIMAKPIHLEDYEEEEIVQRDTSCVDRNYRGPICAPLHSCTNFHILPCQLKAKPKDDREQLTNPPNWQNTEALCFVFKDNFMPPAIFHRLLAACIRNWKIAKLNRKNLMYNNFGVFKVTSQAQLRLWFVDHIVYARMSFMPKHNKQAIDSCVCTDVRRVLNSSLMAILGLLPRSKNFAKTTPYEEYVQCPKINEPGIGLFRVNDLLTDEEIWCDDHEKCDQHTMQTDEALGSWYFDVLKGREEAEMTFEGVDLDIVPTEQHLSKIASCLRKNKEIWLIGIELGLKQVDMERIRKEHFDTRVDFIYHVLLEWRQRKKETLKKLKQVCVAVMMKNSPGDIFEIFAQFNEEMPAEIKGIEKDAIKVYAKALDQGFEKVKRIRLLVVGMFSVGKTSLVNNLVEDLSNKKTQFSVEDQFPPSTERIDVHLCLVDGQNGKWKKQAHEQKAQFVDKIKFAKVDEPFKVTEVDQEIAVPGESMNYQSETMDKTADQDAEEQPIPPVVNDLEQIKQRVVDRKNEPEVNEALGLQKNKIEPNSDEVNAQKAVSSSKETLVSVWDFAGQNLYYPTYHCFPNKRSVYLLLMDMTKDLNTYVEESGTLSGLLNKKFTYLETFKFWLNSIHMNSSIYDQEHDVQPTVILVGTHKDEMKCKEEEKEYKMEEFFTDALESFTNNEEILLHIHQKKFLVNNMAEGDPVFDKLRAEVKNLAEKQHYWNEKSPTSFVQLEKSLDTMRAEGKELVSLSDVQVANRKNLKPVDNRQLRLFLKLQHMFGNILHFDTVYLKEYVILAPQWIIEAFKCFITHKPKKDLKPIYLRLWNEYKDYAIIKPQLMEEIIRRSEDRIRIHGEAVVKYMEHLNIMSKPVENCGEEEEDCEEMANDCFDRITNAVRIPSYNSKMQDFHIVPCQLKAKPNEKKIEELICPKNWETTPALCFVFKDKFMPPAVFHRLLAACIRSWEIAKQTNDGKTETLLFNGIGVFKTCKRSQLRLWYCDHIIYARMIFMQQQKQETREAIERYKCQYVRRQLYKHLMAILGLLPRSMFVTKTTPFEEYIQCPNLKKHKHGLFRVNDFIYKGNMNCSEDHDANDAHSIEKETVLQCWYPDALKEMKKDEENSFGDLNRVLEEHELSEISRGLKEIKEFWLLGIELGISQPTMERLKKDHWKEPRSVFIYHMLHEWKKSKRENATLSSLKRKVFAVQKNSDIELGSIFRCLGTRMQVSGQDAAAANGMASAAESGNLPSETRKYYESKEVHWKNVVPTDRQLKKLAELVGGEWKRLGLQLNLNEPELQQLNLDHHAKGVVIVVYEMLSVWRKRAARPTLWDLGTCIARSGVSFEWDSVPVDVLAETGDQGYEASESPEMDTQTGLDGDAASRMKSETRSQPKKTRTREPRAVHWNNVIPNDKQLMKLASLVGGNLKALGLELNIAHQKLEQLEEHHKRIVKVVYEMFLVWKKQNLKSTLRDLENCIAKSEVSFTWDSVPKDVLASSITSSVYANSAEDMLSRGSEVDATEEQNFFIKMKIEDWQTEDTVFKDTGTMTELMNKDVETMTEFRVMDNIHIYTVEEALTKKPESIINLAVQVIKTEASQSYTNNDNIRRSYYPCLVADRTGSVWLRVYQEHERTTFEAQATIMLKGLLKKTCEHPLWCVSTTELTKREHFEIPHIILDAAIKSSLPSSTPTRSLKEAVKAKSSSTVVGKVVQASTLKRSGYGGLPTKFLYLVESNDNPPVKIALYGIDAQSEFTRGDVIRVKGAYSCNKGQSLSTTEQAKVELLPRDHIDVVIDAVPDSQDPDFLADNDSIEDSELIKVQSATNNWNESFRYGKKYIRSLIRKHLPPPDILDDLCYCYGRKSKIIKDMCDAVLLQIKEKIEALPDCMNIVADIYPSYTLESENHLIFLVTLKGPVDVTLLEEHIPFATEYRVLGCYPNEAEYIYKSEIGELMSERDQLKAKRCINMNSEELFKKHRYLSIITANIQKSRGFKTNSHVQDKQLCIVLFVHAKGFIPIAEDPFSDCYDEIGIDVLEGAFIPYGKTCSDYHDDVKMGCKITRSNIRGGTLGGFIEHHKHGLVGLTCAHALLDIKELSSCKDQVTALVLGDWPSENRDIEKREVFQPEKHDVHNRDPFGHIVEAVYCAGGDKQSGVDAVLFRVEKRFPLSGGFPSVLTDGGFEEPNFSFGSGRIGDPSAFFGAEVAKFGAASEFTKGIFEFREPFLCVKTITLEWMVGTFQMKLFNQYQVRASPENWLFAIPGDSGALVFVKDNRQETVCIGIVEGGEANSQLTAVCPITDVLERFNTRYFKQFQIEEQANQIVRIEKKVDGIEKKIDGIEQKIDKFTDMVSVLAQNLPAKMT